MHFQHPCSSSYLLSFHRLAPRYYCPTTSRHPLRTTTWPNRLPASPGRVSPEHPFLGERLLQFAHRLAMHERLLQFAHRLAMHERLLLPSVTTYSFSYRPSFSCEQFSTRSGILLLQAPRGVSRAPQPVRPRRQRLLTPSTSWLVFATASDRK